MCIKAADLGHAATPWEQHEEWCRRVVTEFYDQVGVTLFQAVLRAGSVSRDAE